MHEYYQFFYLRKCQPNHMEEVTIWFDKELRITVGDIVVGGGYFSGDLQ